MLMTSACYTRHCKHYSGINQPDGTEMSEVHYCAAFPDGIPYEITVGENNHLKPVKDQGNEIIYEKGPFEWETEEGANKLIDNTIRF